MINLYIDYDEAFRPVTSKEIKDNSWVIMEYFEYLRFLEEHYSDVVLGSQELWVMFVMSVREGRTWSEIADEFKLPLPEGWS
jgi:hypothetical protein